MIRRLLGRWIADQRSPQAGPFQPFRIRQLSSHRIVDRSGENRQGGFAMAALTIVAGSIDDAISLVGSALFEMAGKGPPVDCAAGLLI